MQRLLLSLFIFLLLTFTISAQRLAVWDGPSTGANWNDVTNWDTDVAPVTGDTVVFNSTAIVNGASTGTPVQLRLNGAGTQVTLNLDLTIGGSTSTLNTVVVNAGARLVLGGNTFNINPETTSNGIQIGTTADGASVNIQGSATVNITGGNHGINFSNATGNLVMRGTMTISDSGGNGIRHTDGLIENRGALTITGAAANGIDNAATFTNFTSNTTVLTITDAGANGIKNKAIGIFTNDDELIITGGGVTSDGINTEGAFTNTDDINVSGITNEGIDVITGTLLNSGTITLADGITNNRIRTAGDVTNDIGGTIDLGDGKINNTGTITNNGFILSSFGSAAVRLNAGTAVNNGFFSYGGGGFANGPGTFTDEGVNLDDGTSWRIDAMHGCEVKIANVPYTYQLIGMGGGEVGTSSADGTFTFDMTTFSAEDVSIRPTVYNFPGDLKVRLQNATCDPTLPIELAALSATPMPRSIMVKWTTTMEIDNDYMAVERSTNGARFTEIGRIAGNGTRNYTSDYELEDTAPLTGTNYYRLRQVDQDGTTSYSYVVSAEFRGSTTTTISVFPTVVAAGNQLNVDLRASSATSFTLLDAHGRRITSYQLESGAIARLPTTNLKPGMYYLQNANTAVTTRFIVN